MNRPPPWLFVLTGTPYGVVGAFASTVMPYLTSRAELDVGSIGWYGALLQLPTVLLFLYAPLVDLGPRYKHWLVIVSVLGAALLVASCLMPLPAHTTAFLICAAAAQTVSGLVGSCNGALMASTLSDAQRGKASGWYQIGNQSGGGLSAAIVIWMAGNEVEPGVIGAVLAAMMILPSLAALAIAEPVRPPGQAAGVVFRRTFAEVKEVLFSRLGLTGLCLCLSPVGTSALSYYFSGMFRPYGVSATTVALVNGLGGVAMTALGAFLGGYCCDRYNRRVLYLLAGGLTALCGIAMALSPRVELTFIIGVAIYMLLTGFGYAAFTAVVLETIGPGSGAATKFSMYFAAGNTAVLYVGLIDTRFESRYGVEGVIASDAALNLIGVVILALAFWRLGSFGTWRHSEAS